MAGLAGIQVGDATAISRGALIERMEETAASTVYQREEGHCVRVVEALEHARRQRALREAQIRVAHDVLEWGVEEIPRPA